MYSVQCKAYSVQFSVFCMQFAVCNVQFPVFSVQCAVYCYSEIRNPQAGPLVTLTSPAILDTKDIALHYNGLHYNMDCTQFTALQLTALQCTALHYTALQYGLQDRKTLPRVHLISCWGVKLFLPKDCINFVKILFVRTWVFDFFSLTISVFGFHHNSSFLVLLFFEFLSFVAIWIVTIWVFSCVTIWVVFCHKLSFWVLSQLKF